MAEADRGDRAAAPEKRGRGPSAHWCTEMLRMYCLQQRYGLAGEGLEYALYDSQALRDFVGPEPRRTSDLGLVVRTSCDVLEPRHMLSIITWPKPEHDTWVAPSISRAKS
jgi:hypothetical protein